MRSITLADDGRVRGRQGEKPTKRRGSISRSSALTLSRLLASFDGDADPLHVLERGELGDAHLDPRRLEFGHDELRDVLREAFHQQEAVFLERRGDAADDLAVV